MVFSPFRYESRQRKPLAGGQNHNPDPQAPSCLTWCRAYWRHPQASLCSILSPSAFPDGSPNLKKVLLLFVLFSNPTDPQTDY